MRLLNVDTRQLEEFFGDTIPPYAILSHTWGKEEVTLQDLSRGGHQQKQGYAKIEGCCQQAIKDGYLWVWVDTCCIDKTSSAELSEAINSMFRWYENSEVCYAYLQDVPSGTDIYKQDSAFRKSRWFTRGWTLQELLAPRLIHFYDSSWMLISQIYAKGYINFTQGEIVALLSEITLIEGIYLNLHWFPKSNSAAQIFSWMARRSTTRVEDEAYCLLGLLDINMPLLYGEGEKAFVRLQEAILSASDDISLLGWGWNSPSAHIGSLLAKSPAAFFGYPREVVMWQDGQVRRKHTTVTGLGLHIELRMFLIDDWDQLWMGVIAEDQTRRSYSGIGIVIKRQRGNRYVRANGCPPILIGKRNFYGRFHRSIRWKQIYIAQEPDWTTPWWVPARSIWGKFLRVAVDKTTKLAVTISASEIAGYTLSSLWPPMGDSEHFGSYIFCVGPRNRLFYTTFSNKKQDRFAVRIEIEWGRYMPKAVKLAFCVITGQYTRTALEHCCGAKIGYTVPQFAGDMQWKPYLTAKNTVTNEGGYLYSVSKADAFLGEIISCELVWKEGPCSQEGSTEASQPGGS
jgi:hypothetical protein